jgi:hypothetical protein
MEIIRGYLKGGGGSRTIELHGYASEEGSDPFNRELSRRRADIVKLLLGKGGIPSRRIETFAHGRDETYATLEENRRVEVVLVEQAGIPEEGIKPFAPELPEPEQPKVPPGPQIRPRAPGTLETFCRPFATKRLALKVHAATKERLMKFAKKFGSDVQDLWRTYLDTPKTGTKGTLPPRRVFGDQKSRVVKEFREDPETLRERDRIFKLIADGVQKDPSLKPAEGQTTEFRAFRTVLADKDVMDLPMRFTDPTERIPGLIAGGFGKNSSDAGDDVRNVDGQFRVTNLGLDTFRLQVQYVFDILDAIDFCPGAPGSLAAQLAFTDDLSRLEATPDVPTYDTPFEVIVGASDDRLF